MRQQYAGPQETCFAIRCVERQQYAVAQKVQLALLCAKWQHYAGSIVLWLSLDPVSFGNSTHVGKKITTRRLHPMPIN